MSRHTGGVRGPRPKAICPGCQRWTAVTWNQRTGEAILRGHNDKFRGIPCPRSRTVISRQLVYEVQP